jgi:hypothetical protein
MSIHTCGLKIGLHMIPRRWVLSSWKPFLRLSRAGRSGGLKVTFSSKRNFGGGCLVVDDGMFQKAFWFSAFVYYHAASFLWGISCEHLWLDQPGFPLLRTSSTLRVLL